MSHPERVDDDPRFAPGTVLAGRYRVVRLLGEGGMGAVYEAEHTFIKRRVALKVMHERFAQNDISAGRFLREAQAANKIGHPNIVEVTDFGQLEEGPLFMVLEYLEGNDYRDELDEGGPQPIGKTARIVRQLCDGLAAAHAHGIIHRDLKPENVYLAEPKPGSERVVKILDFGVSKFQKTEGLHEMRRTRTGAIVGTPFYMSPEQCFAEDELDARSDVFALGVILYEALTGEYPFYGDSFPKIIFALTSTDPVPIETLRADLPPRLSALIMRMIARDREARPASCEEVARALAIYEEDDSPVPTIVQTFPELDEKTTKDDALRVSSVQRKSSGDDALGRTGRAWLLAVPLLLLVAGVVALTAVLLSSPSADVPTTRDEAPTAAPESVPAEARLPEPAPPVVTAPAVTANAEAARPTPPPAPAPERFTLTVEATPAEATIEIDGQRYASPARVELTPGTVTVRARARGHLSVVREVEVIEDRSVQLVLPTRPDRPAQIVPQIRALPAGPEPRPVRRDRRRLEGADRFGL